MDKDRADEEFCLDTLSDYSSYSESDSDGDSSDSSINTRKPRKLLPLQYSDSESDNDDTAEVNIDTWSTYDKSIILEPFEGSPGIKILLKSEESVMDIVNLFIGDDLLEYLVKESNRYRYQVIDKYKNISRTKKWVDITLPEMKNFLGLIVVMGQVKKERLHDYWSTEPRIETPFFSKVMSRSRFMQILQSWHFCNNEDIPTNSNRLVKVQPVINYLKK
ncbi:PREDICTED: piggyBac transposable element-derived protein 4-like [Eufriesea mexicana]|uniref:piggyBac transposable element-derived protein 4-like n=1 Tax=Eufriesea mexicana TaxID=516756 RepID=UPI00083BC92D|nr:PREDICTED: piggyBac transposable element-derived protein 4-like [Eufriesea mexicana]